MKKRFTHKQITAELKRIQDNAPEHLKKAVMVERDQTPTIRLVAETAIAKKDFPEAKKASLKKLLDAGLFNRKETIINKNVEKQLDNYIKREINKSIKAGRLPANPPKLNVKSTK